MAGCMPLAPEEAPTVPPLVQGARMAAPQREREGRQAGLAMAMRRVSQLGASSTAAGTARGAKKFPNGDTYTGSWRNGVPEGEGRYCWADGSVYEGGWRVSHPAHLLSCLYVGCSRSPHGMHASRAACPGCAGGVNASASTHVETFKHTGLWCM